MDYSIAFLAVVFILGFIGAFASGLVGIGGAVVNYPLLLFIPPLLGLASFTPHEVSGITAVQVFFSTLSGMLAYKKSGFLFKSLIIYMGISVLAGSFIGGYGSDLLSDRGVNTVYGMLAAAAAILMFAPKGAVADVPLDELRFNKVLAVAASFVVGIGAGIVGAGGAFLLVPVMLVLLKIPTRVTIASSLAITFLSSIGSTVGKVATGQVSWIPACVLIVASIIASPLGAKTGQRLNTKVLQFILAAVILAIAIKVWTDLLF